MGWGWGFFKTFLEGSVDYAIYRDYIMIQSFFIYCSLACLPNSVQRSFTVRIMWCAILGAWDSLGTA